jgi:hypothetical protein
LGEAIVGPEPPADNRAFTLPRESEITVGQSWASWESGRQQWLLATVIREKDGLVTLKFDGRYGIATGEDERRVDATTMLSTTNLFRHINKP